MYYYKIDDVDALSQYNRFRFSFGGHIDGCQELSELIVSYTGTVEIFLILAHRVFYFILW
jgi:hypothetical protein